MTADGRPRGELLVAGVGNTFLADDGFGVEVARRLARETLPPGACSAAPSGARSWSAATHLGEEETTC